ncbi:MAG: hypothetical protein AB7U79_04045 [Candidatus Izemoplasmatales bacterium]
MDKQLKYDVERGLGKVYRYLKDKDDIQKYKEDLVHLLLKDQTYDFNFEGSKGLYLYDLVQLFNDPLEFLQPITSKFDSKIRYTLFVQLADLLVLFHHDYKELRIIDKIILKFHELISNKIWSKDSLLKIDYLLIVFSQNLSKKQLLKQIILWQEQLLKHKNCSIQDFGWSIHYINERIPGLIPMDERPEKPGEPRTFEKAFKFASTEDFHQKIFILDDPFELKKLMDFIYSAKDIDEKVLRRLFMTVSLTMSSFNYKKIDYPCIDTQMLLSLFHQYSDPILKQMTLKLMIQYSDLPQRSFGYELLNTSFHAYGIGFILKSYQKNDKMTLFNYVYHLDFSRNNHDVITVVNYFMDFFKHHKSNELNELLFVFYERGVSSYKREEIVKLMDKKKLLTISDYEDLLHDSNQDIRKLAKKVYRNLTK